MRVVVRCLVHDTVVTEVVEGPYIRAQAWPDGRLWVWVHETQHGPCVRAVYHQRAFCADLDRTC